MYYELDVVDEPKWINHIVRTTIADNLVALKIDFSPKYLSHAYGSSDEISGMKHEIYIYDTPETINLGSKGKCEIKIRTERFVEIMTEQSKYGLNIVLFGSMREEFVIYSKDSQ